MKKEKNNKKKFFCKFERLMYKLSIFLIIALIVGIVWSENSMAQMNVEVQREEKEVANQKKRIESLKMKIDEMTSLDNIKEVSEEYGLAYHSDNIKTIDD